MAYGSSGVDHWTAHRPVFLRLPVLEPKSLLYRHGAFYTLRHRHFITFIYHVQYVYILLFIIFIYALALIYAPSLWNLSLKACAVHSTADIERNKGFSPKFTLCS